jgi:hypothetical protein
VLGGVQGDAAADALAATGDEDRASVEIDEIGHGRAPL